MKRSFRKLNRFSYETDIEPVSPTIAQQLLQEFNLNAKEAHYHIDGTYYGGNIGYPLILFDLYGYIILNSQTENRNIKFTKTINVHMGISNLPEYRYYPNSPICLENSYYLIKLTAEKRRATETQRFASMKAIMQNAINKR